MRDYSITSPRFWTGETGRALRAHPNAQRVALYLISAPGSTMIGLYYLPIPTICHDVGLNPKGASEALTKLRQLGFAAHDGHSDWVFVREMARWQVGLTMKGNDKRRAKVVALLRDAAKSPFLKDFYSRYGADYDLPPLSEICGLKGASKGNPDQNLERLQEQEQEQEQDQDQEQDQKQDQGGMLVSSEDGFERFWKAFPSGRKQGKGEARKSWERATAKVDPEVIIAAAAEYAASPTGRGKYVKGPCPWLNQGCWDDDRAAWQRGDSDAPADPTGNLALFEKLGREGI